MAIKLYDRYPTKAVSPSAAYPWGSARNITTPGDGTGTPLEKDWVNDLQGFLQAVAREGGITASGTPDTALTSQFLQGFKAHMNVYYASRAALLANTGAQYRAGETIDMLGVKWAVVASETANGMDILELPDGNFAVYTPTNGVAYAAAMGYSESGTAAANAAVVARAFEIADTVALPAGVTCACSVIDLTTGRSLISDTPGVRSVISNPNVQISGSGVRVTDIGLNGTSAEGSIEVIDATERVTLDNVYITAGTIAIAGGSHVNKNWYLNGVTLDDCVAGITGTGWSGFVTQDLYLYAVTPGAALGINATMVGGYIHGVIKNAGITIGAASRVTFALSKIEATSAAPLLTVSGTGENAIIVQPLIVGSVTYSFTGGDPIGFTSPSARKYTIRCSEMPITALTGNITITAANTGADISLYAADDVSISAGSDAEVRASSGSAKIIATGGGEVKADNTGSHMLGDRVILSHNLAVPTSPTDAGVAGEVRFSSTHIYRCVATNTWRRALIETWT